VISALRARGSVEIPREELPDDLVGWLDELEAATRTAGIRVVFLADEAQLRVVDAED
jgi:hypothetical protein